MLWILLLPPQQFVQKLFESAAESRAGEVINKRVEDAVEVGEAHRRVKSQVGFLKMVTFIVPHFQDPYSDAWNGAGEKAGDENESHGHDELNGALDLPAFVHRPVPVSQLPGYPECAESHDGSGEEELDDVESIVPGAEGAEAHADVETLALRAVAVDEEVLLKQEVACGEADQSPQADRDAQGVAQAHLIDPVPRVDDLQIAVDGHGRQEEDPRRTVGRQQEEQDATGGVTMEPVFATPVIICSERQAEQHDGVGHGQVGEVHRVGLPRVHVEDEHGQGDKVPHQPEHEL